MEKSYSRPKLPGSARMRRRGLARMLLAVAVLVAGPIVLLSLFNQEAKIRFNGYVGGLYTENVISGLKFESASDGALLAKRDRIGAFGTRIEARLQRMAIRHNVIAVQVTFPKSEHFKGTYHITLATAPGVPPKESNNIPEECWMPLDPYHRLNLSCRIGYSLDRKTFYTKPDNQNNSQI